jgi:hypothetical protein
VPALGNGVTLQKSRYLFSLILPDPRIKAALTLAEKQSKAVHFPAPELETSARVSTKLPPVFSKIFLLLVAFSPKNCSKNSDSEISSPKILHSILRQAQIDSTF